MDWYLDTEVAFLFAESADYITEADRPITACAQIALNRHPSLAC
jgi:hypothetical protein